MPTCLEPVFVLVFTLVCDSCPFGHSGHAGNRANGPGCADLSPRASSQRRLFSRECSPAPSSGLRFERGGSMLRVTLLGEQLVHDDATGLARARSSRTTALVGYLACHAGRPQSRQLIAGLFWPDSTDAQALTNLRRELHHLRELLGDIEALKVTASDLTWCDDALCLVDVRTLQQAREQALGAAERGDLADAAARAAEGIAAYGGSFLPGVYDDWADQLREELRLVCLELCDLVAEVGPRNRSVRTRLEAARKRIAVAPLEEVGYRELMTLQADMGDRGGAINTYHHCAAILERELGVDPDPATRAALDRLMGRKPALTKRTTVIDDQQPVRAVQPGAG